jgi:hypothetical protein
VEDLYTTWVWVEEKNDWRAVSHRYPWQKKQRKKYRARVARKLYKRHKRRGNKVVNKLASMGKPTRPPRGERFLTQKEVEDRLISEWLWGDLDANHSLMVKLALVARDIGMRLYVAEGLGS